MSKLLIVGHRGAAGLAPENTLASFKKALELKVDMVEFDVRVSKDNVAVVNHDPFVIIEEQKKLISNLTYKELLAIKPDICTLEESINYIGHKAILNIEIKPEVKLEPIIKILNSYLNIDYKPEDFLISSFDFVILKTLKTNMPNIPVIILEKYFGIRAILRAKKLNTQYICFSQKTLWTGFIRAASSSYKLFTYTINDPKKADKWHRAGLYGIVTDFPDRFNNS